MHLQTVDVSSNRLATFPARLTSLGNVSHLRASHNQLELDHAAWKAFASLTALTKLTLDHNRWRRMLQAKMRTSDISRMFQCLQK